MRKTFWVTVLLALWAGVAWADSLDDILAANTRAMGGAAAWAAVDSVRFELEIHEPGLEARAVYVAARDGRMRIDVFVGDERVFAEGLSGAHGGAWQWSPDAGIQSVGAEGAAALRHGVEGPGRFYTLEGVRARGGVMELVGGDTWQVRYIPLIGPPVDYYIDRASGLALREVSHRAFHPDIDPTEVPIETVHSEPEWIDGVLRYRRTDQHRADTGAWLGTTVVRSLEHNPELPADFFEPR